MIVITVSGLTISLFHVRILCEATNTPRHFQFQHLVWTLTLQRLLINFRDSKHLPLGVSLVLYPLHAHQYVIAPTSYRKSTIRWRSRVLTGAPSSLRSHRDIITRTLLLAFKRQEETNNRAKQDQEGGQTTRKRKEIERTLTRLSQTIRHKQYMASKVPGCSQQHRNEHSEWNRTWNSNRFGACLRAGLFLCPISIDDLITWLKQHGRDEDSSVPPPCKVPVVVAMILRFSWHSTLMS